MMPLETFQVKADNTCDICGACCTEQLYEFRCYKKKATNETMPQRLLNLNRLLGYPF